jgi:hypothetical protein
MRILLIVLVIVLLTGWGVMNGRDPYRAYLPLGTEDMGSIRSELDRLPKDERDLVEGYAKRAKGRIAEAAYSDSGEPYTARTVADAIVLQREFLARTGAKEARMPSAEAQRETAREDRLAPMRRAISLDLLDRRIMTPEQRLDELGANHVPGTAKRGIKKGESILIMTFRLSNRSVSEIGTAKVWAAVRKADTGQTLAECYINFSGTLAVNDSTEIRCQRKGDPTDADRKFVDIPDRDLSLEWVPSYVRFSNGSVPG